MPEAPIIWHGLRLADLLTIAALIFGPLLAVAITFLRENIKATHDRRMLIYRTLMATRKIAISTDHVGAINLIEVEFHGEKDVEGAWKTYTNHLTAYPQNPSEEQQQAWEGTRNDLLAVLIARIAKRLGIRKGEIEIKNGGYAPDGWRYRDNRSGGIQDFAWSITKGEKAFPIIVLQPQQPAAPPPTPPGR